MKKVIVFGATGTVGKHLVQLNLKEGNLVTAFCRNKASLQGISHANLSIFEGDVLNKQNVLAAIKGQEAVVVTLGSGKSRVSTVRSEGTKMIIEAMKTQNVKRLICQTTLGNGESRGNLNFFWKRVMFGWFLKQVYLDHELQEEYVRKSDLDWTIVRPAAFTDGEKTGKYRHGFAPTDKKLTLKISRADIAHFIVNELKTNTYLFQTPGLSY